MYLTNVGVANTVVSLVSLTGFNRLLAMKSSASLPFNPEFFKHSKIWHSFYWNILAVFCELQKKHATPSEYISWFRHRQKLFFTELVSLLLKLQAKRLWPEGVPGRGLSW